MFCDQVVYLILQMSDMANGDLEKYAKALDKLAFPPFCPLLEN